MCKMTILSKYSLLIRQVPQRKCRIGKKLRKALPKRWGQVIQADPFLNSTK